MKVIKLVLRFLFRLIKWVFLFVIALTIISGLYNLTLPDRSQTTEYLTDSQKAYIAEMMNLQKELGNSVWPNWGNLHTPVIVYNEKYAFLIGYPDPPAGWYKMPGKDFRGADWELITGEDFLGEKYYRQRLPDSNITPENFTVTVGDTWVATMQTKEYAAIAFYTGFKKEMPPVIRSIFPYRLFWNLIMGNAENYIAALTHESFHVFQGTFAPEKLEMGETATYLADEYPWSNKFNAAGWVKEIDWLMKAFEADGKAETKEFTRQFLETRQQRRMNANLTAEQIGFEQKREWLEGLAKYAELNIVVKAQFSSDYKPLDEASGLKDFKEYKKSQKTFHQQVNEAPRTANRRGDSRFYQGGMLQAVILDKLMPGWKIQALDSNVFLDELLTQAVDN